MFFKHIRHNAKKDRKNNVLFFSSLIIAIIAFYTLLSVGDQDIMAFLRTIESQAINNFMSLIPIVYLVSLFFVFFLVYFAYRYQLEHRRKEFGLYFMFGMTHKKFFLLLLSETMWNSFISLLLGIPLAILLNEAISLATAKIVGLGIIGHTISFSFLTILGTIGGVLVVQLSAMVFLVRSFSQKEPLELVRSVAAEKQNELEKQQSLNNFIGGVACLLVTYLLGITLMRLLNIIIMLVIIILGIGGTFLLYRGIGAFIGRHVQKRSGQQSGLFTFTSRQIQENVVYQHKSLAISSLLLVLAISWFSFGVGVATSSTSSQSRSVDISIQGAEENVRKVLDSDLSQSMIETYYPMRVSMMTDGGSSRGTSGKTESTNEHVISWDGLTEVLRPIAKKNGVEQMLFDFVARESHQYLIPITSYNDLLRAMGKEVLQIKANEVALYSSDSLAHSES